MEKKAFLISSSAMETETPLHGVLKDIDNMNNFLKSPKGGAWYNYEIFCKDEPDDNDIRMIREYDGDYSLLFIASHGFYNGEIQQQCFEINKKIYQLRDFFTKAQKQLIIIDACREYHEYRSMEYFSESHNIKTNNAIYNELYREIYNYYINSCNDGIVVAYSTDINNVACEDKNIGGLFTNELIEVAKNNIYSVMSIRKAVSIVRKQFGIKGINQKPIIESLKIRRANYFPFSINIYN